MNLRILVVEDDEPSRHLLCDWLETEGYAPDTAANLREAYAALSDRPPHAVLLDVGLGAEDGLEVARWMRTQPGLEQVPVIAVSAHAMVTHRAAMMRAGCNSFLAKPVDFVALQRQLRDWLGQARTAAQEQA